MKKYLLFAITIVLFLMNIYVIQFYGLDVSRRACLISNLVLLCFFLAYRGFKNKKLLIAFLFLILGDILMLNFENIINKNLTLLSIIIGYSFISLHIFLKINKIKTKKGLFRVVAVSLTALTIMLVTIIDVVDFKLSGIIHKLLFYIYGIAIIFMLILVSIYNFRYYSLQSTLCVYFVLGLFLSDIFVLIAYYLDFEIFYFPNRIFYLLGTSMLVWYSILDFGEEVVFEDESFLEEKAK
ncbi:hypothetical protein ES676_01210 [Bizionia saleffrena]|uniref:YhhN-like protein n=1 Tax=Bizionia saleffrena TaxID=291189 RepID=A0A8H2LGY9_9FLAO|nr:hypothetical protein [Bizionia saleffrena]TYB80317.1 hypothetical protein ES676_01210 [Bizionia saleffrena]